MAELVFDKGLKWAGTAFTVLGAITTVCKLDPANVYFFNLGSIFWLWAAVRMKEPPLIAVNALLLLVYFFGTFLRLH